MLRTCGKGMMVAVAGVAALVLVGAGCTIEQTSQTPAFARIAVSEKSVVYVQIQGDELRAATSAAELQTAAPVKAGSEFTLPLPADQLPAGVTAIKARLGLQQYQVRNSEGPALTRFISGQLTVCRTDDQKVEWQYVSQCGVQAFADVVKARSLELPDPDKVKATLEINPASGKLAIGLRLTADGAALTDVRKDGRPVQVKMVVADASGAEIASKVGALADFGFS